MGRGSDETFGDLLGLQEKLCRLFDEQSARVRGDRETMHSQWSPAVDIYETSDAYVLVAEVPGVPQKEVHLEITDDLLVLRGERPSAMAEATHSYHRVERPHGVFQRVFRLPLLVDPKGVHASCREGVLRVVLPKKDAEQPRSVSVEVDV